MLEQNALSPIGTPRSSKLGMLDEGIEVGNNDKTSFSQSISGWVVGALLMCLNPLR